jgi:endonuclease/exonuclease/phosphatase family metal-dependent hydrolase
MRPANPPRSVHRGSATGLLRARRVLAASFGHLVAIALLAGGCGGLWRPPDLDRIVAPAPPLGPHEFTLVTFNALRLRQTHRVPRLVATLTALGTSLHTDGNAPSLPDVVALQELEDEAPIASLRATIEPTHAFITCVCARRIDGSLRSMVGLAVRRARFSVTEASCVSIGVLWLDHPRCMAVARLRPREEPVQIDVVAVHLSWVPFNAPQARMLRHQLAVMGVLGQPRVLVAGDLNAASRGWTWRLLSAPPLRDPFPATRPTHWFSGQIDHVLVGRGIALVYPLDRRLAWDLVRPVRGSSLPPHCRRGEAPDCPLSDHLPEGGVFRYDVPVLPRR